MVLTSVKSYSSYNAEHIPSFFTLTPTMQNYADAFTAVPLGKYLLNTLIFHIGHHRHYDGRDHPLRFCFLQGLSSGEKIWPLPYFSPLMMIPNELVIITNFVTITNLDMRNTFLGLILPLCHLRILHLPSERKFRAGSGRALPGSQGGRHLRSEIPVQGYDPHLQAHYGDHRHPEGN